MSESAKDNVKLNLEFSISRCLCSAADFPHYHLTNTDVIEAHEFERMFKRATNNENTDFNANISVILNGKKA